MALGAPPRVVRCPGCGHAQKLPQEFSGREILCPACGKTLDLEALASQITPAPDASGVDKQDQTADLGALKRFGAPAGEPAGGEAPPRRISQAGLLAAGTPTPDPLLETVLGKCLLKRRLGEGGMGTVYLGRHLTLDIDVAVKVLPPALAQRDRGFVERFLREARVAARVHHPNIVQVLDVDFQKGCYFLVMEYVAGESAGERLRRKRMLSEREVIEIGMDLAAALEYARRKEIIHRDIKPENILISPEGEVKIADLGLAKRTAGDTGSGLTLRDQALGTPFYISPEQATDARNADHRSDLYSLGATLFHLATGRPPFLGTSAFDTMTKHLNEPAPELRAFRAECSLDLAGLIRRLMQKDPRERYQTAGQLFIALRTLYEKLVPQSERDAALTGTGPSGSGANPRVLSTSALGAHPSSLRLDGSSLPARTPTGGSGTRAPVPGPAAPLSPAQAEGSLLDRLVLRAEIPNAPPLAQASARVAADSEHRPSRVWQAFLIVPFANALAFLWAGTLARKNAWFYGGLGLLAAQALFLYLWQQEGEQYVAPFGFGLVYFAGLLYGFAIRGEFEARAIEVARAEDEELRRDPGRD